MCSVPSPIGTIPSRHCSRGLSGGVGNECDRPQRRAFRVAGIKRRGPRAMSWGRSRDLAACDRALPARVTGRCWITPNAVTPERLLRCTTGVPPAAGARLPVGARGSAPRYGSSSIGTIPTSPIWRSACQGGRGRWPMCGWRWQWMWLRLAGRSGRPRVRDGGHAHIRGLLPRPWFVARARCARRSRQVVARRVAHVHLWSRIARQSAGG
jgi:hypothetical protein